MAKLSTPIRWQRNRMAVRGTGKIGSFMDGAVTRIDGSVVSVAVEIFILPGNRRIGVVESDQSGAWTVENLSMSNSYWVRIRDRARQANGAVLDWLDPVEM